MEYSQTCLLRYHRFLGLPLLTGSTAYNICYTTFLLHEKKVRNKTPLIRNVTLIIFRISHEILKIIKLRNVSEQKDLLDSSL